MESGLTKINKSFIFHGYLYYFDIPIMDMISIGSSFKRCQGGDEQRKLIVDQMIGCVTSRAAGWSADLVQEIYSSLAKDLHHNSHEVTNLALALLYDEKRLDALSSDCNLRLSDKVLKEKHGHQPQSRNTVGQVRPRVENDDEHNSNRKKTKPAK